MHRIRQQSKRITNGEGGGGGGGAFHICLHVHDFVYTDLPTPTTNFPGGGLTFFTFSLVIHIIHFKLFLIEVAHGGQLRLSRFQQLTTKQLLTMKT